MYGIPTPRVAGVLAASGHVTGGVYWRRGGMSEYDSGYPDPRQAKQENYGMEREFYFYDNNRQLLR